MIFQKLFFRKLWWDGRIGHSTYLMYFLVFVNFILISYNFLIEGNSIFEKYFPNLLLFSVIFIISYIPISIIIGRWHTENQISIEMTMKHSEDPILAKMFRTLLDSKTGNSLNDEIQEFKKLLKDIEKKYE